MIVETRSARSRRGQGGAAELIIEPEQPKALAAIAECALLKEAVRRNPDSPVLRLRLAKLLNLVDAFGETIELLGGAKPESLGAADMLVLAHALLARDEPGDARAARDLAERAAALATSDSDRSIALAEVAKAASRLRDSAAVVMLLEEALRLDPANASACKRLSSHYLRDDRPEAALHLTDRLAAEGVRHSRLLSARMVALARLGRTDEAEALLGLGRFVRSQQLPTPSGWDTLQAFNRDLAAELSAHSGQRHGRHGTASRETVRIDAPATGHAPAARALLARIAQVAQQHVSGLGEDEDDPWIAARPRRALLSSWCVITEREGFEDWHTHPQGWMSGVYYVEVPQSVSDGEGEAGCLALGLPEGLVGEEASAIFGRQVVRPRAGLLVLFPSHCYHRTFPHRSPGRRIGISFDLRPA